MSTVTLTGIYHNGPGEVCAGTVTFQLEQTETDGSSTFFVGVPTTVTLDSSGAFSVVLTSTDGLSPIASYRVTERIRDAKQRVYWIQLAATPATQNLAGLVGYTAPVGTATAVELIVDLVPIAQAAATAAQASQTAAAASATAAQAAQAAAEAAEAGATAPTDAMVASLVPNTGSATGAALLADYVDRASAGRVNVKGPAYGAKGDGIADDTAAINAAAAVGIPYFPPGHYKVSDTITFGAVGSLTTGAMVVGAGKSATFIEPTSALGSKPVFKFINGRMCGVADLAIRGNFTTPVQAAVEFHRDTPGAGAPAVTQNFMRNVTVGATSAGDGVGVAKGVRVTCAVGQDGNNDFMLLDNVNVAQFTDTAFSFEMKESVGNVILGGGASGGPIAVAVQGGSVSVGGGFALNEITDAEFDFQAPASLTYTQASSITDVFSECDLGNAATFVRTTTDPGISILVSGYHRYGSEAGIALVNYQSDGLFAWFDSYLDLGKAATVTTTSAASNLILSGVVYDSSVTVSHAGSCTIIGGSGALPTRTGSVAAVVVKDGIKVAGGASAVTVGDGSAVEAYYVANNGPGWGAGYKIHEAGTEKWRIYKNNADPSLYIRDVANGLMHQKLTPGSGTTGKTEFAGGIQVDGSVGFYGTAPAAKPTVIGSRGGNAALASLLTALAGLGLITDSTTA